MAADALAVERKKAEANENTFVVRPPLRLRFPVTAAREVVARVLRERVTPSTTYTTELGKEMADLVRSKLKGAELHCPRYKLFVHVVVGQRLGEGMQMASRCMWDVSTDAVVSEHVMTTSLFVVATVYGVYLN